MFLEKEIWEIYFLRKQLSVIKNNVLFRLLRFYIFPQNNTLMIT